MISDSVNTTKELVNNEPHDRYRTLQREVTEIARELMRKRPGTSLADVWDDALTIHRQRRGGASTTFSGHTAREEGTEARSAGGETAAQHACPE